MFKSPETRYWELFAPIAGVLFTLGFSPFDFQYLVILALIFLFASWQDINPGRAFLRGLLFGLGMFGVGVSWVYISIHDMGKVGVSVSFLLTSTFVALWALFPALAGYFSASLLSRINVTIRIFIIPLVWTLIEFVRGTWFLNGFPWLLTAYSQLDTPLVGYMPLLGVYGAGFVLALTAAVIAKQFTSAQYRKVIIAGITLLWALGGFLQTIHWTHPIGAPIDVALVQGNIAQDQKWRSENKLKTMALYQAMSEQQWDADLIIWPETAIPAYVAEVNEAFLKPLAEQAKQHGTDLIISVPAKDLSETHRYNAVITLGRQEGMYQKKHLLPFGEYLPLQPLSGFVLNTIKLKLGEFTPGNADQPLLMAAGYAFLTSVCYEDVFAESNANDLAAAAYLVNVTNDAWFGRSIEPYQHMQIARMRALESGRYLLRATNTGQTGIVSPEGKIIAQAPLFQEFVLAGEIVPMAGMTPFASWGDNVVMLSIVLLMIALLALNLFYKRFADQQLE